MIAKQQESGIAAHAPEPTKAIEIPPALKQFDGKTPRELFLGHGVTQQQVESTAAMVHGFIGDFGIPIPDFAKKASKQFWKNFLGKRFDPQTDIENAGVISRLLELMGMDAKAWSHSTLGKKVMPAAKPLADTMQNVALTLSTENTAKFFAGRARAEKIFLNLNSPDYIKMIKRAPIYITLAVAWREFEKLQSQAEAERWLRDKQVIGKNFDSGEVRAVFRVVGLSYGKKPGRPKKIKRTPDIP